MKTESIATIFRCLLKIKCLLPTVCSFYYPFKSGQAHRPSLLDFGLSRVGTFHILGTLAYPALFKLTYQQRVNRPSLLT